MGSCSWANYWHDGKNDREELGCGMSVAITWASPDCAHFAKTKRAKPIEKRVRPLIGQNLDRMLKSYIRTKTLLAPIFDPDLDAIDGENILGPQEEDRNG